MLSIRRWSIKTKLIMLSVVAVGAALAMACTGVMLNEVRTTRALKSEALKSQTKMLAFNSAGVLSFKDVSAAKQLLASLHVQPTVRFAVLYDDSGQALAAYPAKLDPLPPAPPAADDVCRFTETGDIEIVDGVMDRKDRLGTLYRLRKHRRPPPPVRAECGGRRGVAGPRPGRLRAAGRLDAAGHFRPDSAACQGRLPDYLFGRLFHSRPAAVRG